MRLACDAKDDVAARRDGRGAGGDERSERDEERKEDGARRVVGRRGGLPASEGRRC